MEPSTEIKSYPDIAIVGMAGRFPGAANIEQFWRNLCRGVESLTRFTEAELIDSGIDPQLLADPDYVPVSGALEGSGQFAASFFGYSAREALLMDPQQRLFLESAWEALEHAGHGSPPSATGVFASVSVCTYLLNRLIHRPDLLDGLVSLETTLGSDKDFLASRVAYKLGLEGPAVVVQSACSSSLVAVHLACRALAAGEVELALAGGSSVDVPQRAGYLYRPESIYSADGHCRPFDHRASGMVGGSGVGVVALKRLDRAMRDHDTIHAVILGSAINNDGANKVGYSAPSVDGQAEVISRALQAACIEPESIGYVEAHGTGTALGDPIEVAALRQAFATDQRGYCALGAVKSNIGHLNAAAGVTGLIKAALVLREGRIPPTLHFEAPNANIELDRSPFRVNAQLEDWPATGQPRRAAVSAFGIGGTNAHVVMQEPPESSRPGRDGQPRPHLLMLSARLPGELEQAGQRLASHLEEHPDVDLADVAFTLQAGRKAFRQRRALVSDTTTEAIRALRDAGSQRGRQASDPPPPVTFLFPGQGAQHPNMARDLYQKQPVFRQTLDSCCDLLDPILGLDLRRAVFADSDHEAAAERLKQTQLTQCALFAFEYALTQQWRALGCDPESLIGHSIGEYVAACIAGVFSLEDALRLVAERGRLLQETTPGAMLAVTLEPGKVQGRLSGDVSIAAVNHPLTCVISGSFEAIAEMERKLAQDGVACQRLQTSHAFHSPMVENALEPLRRYISALNLRPPSLPFVSNVTGSWITAEEATDPDYWARHLRRPVRFAEGLATLLEGSDRTFLEVGPGTTLSNLLRQHPALKPEHRVVSSLPHPKDSRSAEQTFLAALGDLWMAGVDLDFTNLDRGAECWRIPLPSYPFERQRYWVEAGTSMAGRSAKSPQAGRRSDASEWAYAPSWRRAAPADPRELAEVPLLILGDETLGGDLSLQTGRRTVRVFAAREYCNPDEDRYGIDPWVPEHYDMLFDDLSISGDIQLLHLWALPGALGADSNTGRDPGFDTLFLLGKAFGRLPGHKDLVVVTDRLYDVIGTETLQPDQATILGPCRVLPLEYPGLQCRNIDICRENGRLHAAARGQILQELSSAGGEPVVACRGPHRWLPVFESFQLPPAAAAAQFLPSAGTYIVTGGLSGIGAAIAEHLCAEYQARVAVLSRTRLPPRETWNDILQSAGNEGALHRAIRAMMRIEGAGGKVLAIAADVTDRESLADAIERTRKELGPIDGAIHAAGLPGGGVIELKSLDEARRVMAAKIAGTRNLFDLLQPRGTRFLFLCSSLAAETGGFGQVDYCAANAFQDAFACAHNGKMRVHAVNWDTWSETGMAVHTPVPAELQAARNEALRLGLKSREGQGLFPRLLASGQARTLISTRPLMERLESADTVPTEAQDTDLGEAETAPDLISPRPEQSVEYLAPRTPVELKLAAIWKGLFGLETIGVRDNFFELGGHSLLATQLLNRVRKTFVAADRLTLAVLFDGPTIEELAAHLIPSPATGETEGLPSLDDLAQRTPEERRAFFQDYLATRLDPESHAGQHGENLDIVAVAPQIIWDLKRDFRLMFYPHELGGVRRIEDVVDRVAAAAAGPGQPKPDIEPGEFKLSVRRSPLPFTGDASPNPPMMFVLSPPRSGSTLLRIMLAGHPGLFCPPELALLTAADMAGWSKHQLGIFEQDGLTRALMELRGLQADEAHSQIAEFVERGETIQRVYRALQEACGDRLLVDKSPAYALDAQVLDRAEMLFSQSRYVFLVRHPYAVIDSLVRHRMDKLLAAGTVDDPWRFAEYVWATCCKNLKRFTSTVSSRSHLLRYEDLVREPEPAMRGICDFLGLEFHESMLEPYAGGRMIDGPGDPDIFQHDHIEAGLADAWRQVRLPFTLQPETARLALNLGYELKERDVPADRPAMVVDSSLDAAEAGRLLDQLDGLSDAEVEAALKSLLPDQEHDR